MDSDQLTWGNAVHKALELRVGYGEPLPPPMKSYEPMAAKLAAAKGKILVEQQLAIDKDFAATAWFAPDAWFRAKIDVVVAMGPVALLGDYKTGKIVEDSVQLTLAAAAAFAHMPEVQRIRSRFYWLADGVDTTVDVGREDMPAFWSSIWPRIEALRKAHESGVYPAVPNRLCKRWCPVKTCEHWGR